MNFNLENIAEIFKNKVINELNLDTLTLDQFIEFIYEEIKNASGNHPAFLTAEFRENFIEKIKNNIKSKGEKSLNIPFNIDIDGICKTLDATYNPETETFKLNKVIKI